MPTVALTSGKITGTQDQTLTAGKLGSFTVGADNTIVLGPTLHFFAPAFPARRTGPHRTKGSWPLPVTNQVTTGLDNRRRSATHPDTDIALNCGNPTENDAARRCRPAW